MTTHPRTAASTHTFLQRTNALMDMIDMLFNAAMEQPNPSEDLKHALIVGERWAKKLKAAESRRMTAEHMATEKKQFQVLRLAEDILHVEEV